MSTPTVLHDTLVLAAEDDLRVDHCHPGTTWTKPLTSTDWPVNWPTPPRSSGPHRAFLAQSLVGR